MITPKNKWYKSIFFWLFAATALCFLVYGGYTKDFVALLEALPWSVIAGFFALEKKASHQSTAESQAYSQSDVQTQSMAEAQNTNQTALTINNNILPAIPDNAPNKATISTVQSIKQGCASYGNYRRPRKSILWRVTYGASFHTPPVIILSVTKLDLTSYVRNAAQQIETDGTNNLGSITHINGYIRDAVTRYSCTAKNISPNSCLVELRTWSSNLIYGAEVTCTVIGDMINSPSHKDLECTIEDMNPHYSDEPLK